MLLKLKLFFTPTQYSKTDGINYWRELLFLAVLPVIFVFGFIALVFGVYLAIREGFTMIAVFNILAYLSLFLLVQKKIRLKTRSIILLLVVYLLALVLLVILGPMGAGYIYLIAFSVIASLLLGLKASIITIAINILTILFIGLGLKTGLFGRLLITNYNWIGWFTASINIILVNFTSAIPVAVILNGLEKSMEKQLSLQKQLVAEQNQLKLTAQKLEDANKLKNDFIANLSHEIRTPLNAIIGFSELLNNSYNDYKDDTEVFSNIIFSNGHYLLNLINSIMDISLIEAGKLNITIEQTTVAEIIDELNTKYPKKQLTDKPVVLIFPDTQNLDKIVLNTDKYRVTQILINLINNAIKFTKLGHIKLETETGQQHIVFILSDTGIGIPTDKQKDIFKRFERIKQNYETIEGVGIGLTISIGLANLLGAGLKLKSEPGSGTTFWLKIPISGN